MTKRAGNIEVTSDGKVWMVSCGTKTPDQARKLAAELEAAADEAEGLVPPCRA